MEDKIKIIIDTREKSCLEFTHPYITEVIHQKLDVGDYGCIFEDGHDPQVYFERKSIADLYGTLGKGYKRFKNEILRSKESKSWLIIIIEGSMTKVLKGYERSQRNPDELVQQLFTLMIRHYIPFVCCTSREEMSRFIVEVYLALGRKRLKEADNGR